ncbi:ATP-binding protein [Microbacterium sp. NPDC090007]|uniref:hybrid sensor histidine kinase/response regulator n=1 Tax=Microbacterium sp. NPDC090007 TaxID=3364204 RepID=UPI0038049B39
MTRRNLLGREPGRRPFVWTAFVGAAVVLVAYAVALAVVPVGGVGLALPRILLEAIACALVVLRVVRLPHERVAWSAMAAALAALVVADAITSLTTVPGQTLRFIAPAVNLLFFLGLLVSLGLVVRHRFSRLSLVTWLDALISTLGLLTVVFFFTAQAGVTQQAALLSLAYLVPSLLYLSVLVALLAALNRRPSAAWWLSLAAAVLLFITGLAVGPAVALGQPRPPSPVDALWPAAALLLAMSSWSPPANRSTSNGALRVVVFVPALFTTGALAILVVNEIDAGGGLIEFLAFATLGAGIVRLLVSVVEAERLRRRERELSSSVERARDAALSATTAKSRFLATMSHEMRTPLNSILGMNELLASTDLDPAQRDYVDRAMASGALLLDVVTDILDFSKIEAGAIDLVHAPFDLRRLVTSTVTVLSFAAESKGLTVRALVDDSVPDFVMGDATRLRQVLVNLLGNAVKFTSAGDVTIRVSPGSDPDAVLFEVSDTGMGITEDARERIFEPFTQADESTTRTHGGTGLGLSICDALVRMMGGVIVVDSEVGRGSRFSFQIALAHAEPPARSGRTVVRVGRERSVSESPGDHVSVVAPSPATTGPTSSPVTSGLTSSPVTSAAASSRALGPLHVLVAEDNPTLQVLSTQILARLGHRAAVASNGTEALTAVQREAFDIVLMDVHMPVLDGLEATRRIRDAGDALAQPYIIALTAGATEQDREECLEAGMNGYVTKPFTMKDIRYAFETAELHAPSAESVPSVHRFALLNDLGPEVKADVLRTFLERSVEDVQAIADAVRRGEADEARSLAHRLRGASLALGASDLAQACARIEQGSDEQALDPRRADAVRDGAARVAADAERELRALSER